MPHVIVVNLLFFKGARRTLTQTDNDAHTHTGELRNKTKQLCVTCACVSVCVRDATEDKLCCAGPVCSNVIDQSELYRLESNDNNKIKSMQIHESKRKYSQSESKCNLLLEIHICMYVCMYVCICVCVCVMQTTMNFCACMGA